MQHFAVGAGARLVAKLSGEPGFAVYAEARARCPRLYVSNRQFLPLGVKFVAGEQERQRDTGDLYVAGAVERPGRQQQCQSGDDK